MEVRRISYPYPPRSDGEAISDTTPYPIALVAYIQISNVSRPMKLSGTEKDIGTSTFSTLQQSQNEQRCPTTLHRPSYCPSSSHNSHITYDSWCNSRYYHIRSDSEIYIFDCDMEGRRQGVYGGKEDEGGSKGNEETVRRFCILLKCD